jgi:large subunit ribosomal protein L25
MEEIILQAELRDAIGTNRSKKLRHAGIIPAVVYSEGKENMPIQVQRGEFLKMLHQHRVENVIISLQIKDDKKKKPRACMMKEIQQDPVKGEIQHIDFNEISLTKAIKVSVPVATKGEATGVKNDGGALELILWEIEIECLPTDIPKNIEIDISALKIADTVHIKDIAFPKNVKVLNEPDAIVLTIAAPMKEEVAAAVEGEEKPELEVIKEKKPEAGEAAPAAGKDKEKKEEKK